MPQPPHILYILSDEHRGQAMGHAGDPNDKTPQMDDLAANGISFSEARANCPICVPSRATIFSGRHAHASPVSAFFDTWKAAAPSTATLLRDAGYHTCFIGKWHLALVRDQKGPGVRAEPDRFRDSWAATGSAGARSSRMRSRSASRCFFTSRGASRLKA